MQKWHWWHDYTLKEYLHIKWEGFVKWFWKVTWGTRPIPIWLAHYWFSRYFVEQDETAAVWVNLRFYVAACRLKRAKYIPPIVGGEIGRYAGASFIETTLIPPQL